MAVVGRAPFSHIWCLISSFFVLQYTLQRKNFMHFENMVKVLIVVKWYMHCNMRVIIFSHESDTDGLFSAAIGLIRYPQARTIFLSYGIENFIKMRDFIYSAVSPNKEGGIFIISDLGLNDNLIDLCKNIFSNAKKNGWQTIWVDHHLWSQRAIDTLKPYVELVINSSGQKCAADLMYETFLSGNNTAAKLSSIAHTT